MAVYDFFLSRNNGPTVDNYVGHAGRLFYDPAERVLRISNGSTAGGEIFNGYVAVTATEPTQNFQGQVWLNPNTNELSIYHNGNFIPTIDVATDVKLGGIKLGPGVTTNSEGQIIIDSSGLDFSFGDFAAIEGLYSDSTAYALLSSVKSNEDIVLASNGTGDIKVVGGFEVYATNGDITGSLEDAKPIFRVLDDGQVRILVPLADTQEGGVEIIGSLLGTSLAPGIAGTMLHLTGNAGESTRVYHDTLGDYSSYVFRRYNGSVVTPTAVLANQDIGRINWTAATSSGMGNVATAQIRVTALENQTVTAQGSKITFTVTPIGSAATSRVDALVVTSDTVSAIGAIADSEGDVRSVPINSQGGAYNLAATDNGKMISITTGGVSVLQNVFASPYGQIISIFNNSNSSQTITQGAGVTLRLAGTAATGNRTLARYGVATITCVAANTFVISGAGLT